VTPHINITVILLEQNESLLNIRLSKCSCILEKSRKTTQESKVTLLLFKPKPLVLHIPDAWDERKQLKYIGRGDLNPTIIRISNEVI